MTLCPEKLRILAAANLLTVLMFASQVGAAATVNYITVSPPSSTIDNGQMQSFVATGALTDGTTSTLSPVTSLSAAAWHACALLASGAVRCWGRNDDGALGDGTEISSLSSVPVSGIDGSTTAATAISAGFLYSCALTKSAAVECWGENAYGQLGNGTTTDSAVPVMVTGINGVTAKATSVSTWNLHTCAILDTGALECWGANDYGTLGVGSYQPADSTTPLVVKGIDGTTAKATSVSVGYYFSCAVLASGAAECWGRNDYGQLGDGTTTLSNTPMTVSGLSSGVRAVAVSTGGLHACALLVSGAIECWGANSYGQLGDGTTTDSDVPVQVNGIDGITDTAAAVTVGSFHTCALLDSGAVKCWGRNDDGEVGNGGTNDALTPQTVTGLDGSGDIATDVSAGGYYTCALLTSGEVRCWGGNDYGILGNGSNIGSPLPVTLTAPLGLSWYSSNPSVATIDSTGVATAVAPGTTTITASYGSLTKTSTLTVNAIPSNIDVVEELLKMVDQLHLGHHRGRGVKHQLKHELRRTWHDLKHINDRSIARACRSLWRFDEIVGRTSDRLISADKASQLIDAATQIRSALQCSDYNTWNHWRGGEDAKPRFSDDQHGHFRAESSMGNSWYGR